jgi:hypothetical protein
MFRLTEHPFFIFAIALIVLWASAKVGTRFAHRIEHVRSDFNTIMTATLTLLGLIVGFTFSMAVAGYNQRENSEEEEANAIGTEYVRADLLPPSESESIRRLLQEYLDLRISFYKAQDRKSLEQINADTWQLQQKLWASAKSTSVTSSTPTLALAIGGMNDVLKSQSYTQAAWSSRIPRSAWILLSVIAVCANLMVGLSLRCVRTNGFLILLLTGLVSASLFLIADIDSPLGGMVHVEPRNLTNLAQSLRR